MLIAFTLGILSSLHCAGMCGGIIAATTLGLSAHRFRLVLLSNLGRLVSYAIVGAAMAAAAGSGAERWFPVRGHLVLSVLAAVILLGAGLQVGGWFNVWAAIERAAGRFWSHLQRLTRMLLPLRSAWQAFAFGLLWGWLPCGLVYSAAAWAAASGNTLQGALHMLAFGAGTMPAVMGIGVSGAAVLPWLQRRRIRAAAGAVLIVLGGISVAQNLYHLSHAPAAAQGQHLQHQH